MAHSASGSFSGQAPLALSSCRFTGAKLPEEFRIKLPTVVGNDRIWDTESATNVSPDEIFSLRCRYGCQGFGFHPFGEVVDGNHCVFYMPLALRHRTNQVQSPLCERPRANNRYKRFGRDMRNVTEALVFVTPFH
ncbi:hypothetical protein L3X38_021719 [Prunus dulcis]|uniref:Uncharacterized protein n=1 Tax=Prunus dulcis TaxID=3755 RepID=A0AAD4VUT9_PRUDU|nr:hypothetical protein L3X38_021719 [Prunus dulcis]